MTAHGRRFGSIRASKRSAPATPELFPGAEAAPKRAATPSLAGLDPGQREEVDTGSPPARVSVPTRCERLPNGVEWTDWIEVDAAVADFWDARLWR